MNLKELNFVGSAQAVGLIAGIGEGLASSNLKLGLPVASVTYGGFSEYREVFFLSTIVLSRSKMSGPKIDTFSSPPTSLSISKSRQYQISS